MTIYKDESSLNKKETEEVDKKLESVVSTEGKVVKSSGIGHFLRKLVADDTKSIKEFIVDGVIIPTIKDGIADIFHNAVDVCIYGTSRPRSRYTNYSKSSLKLTGAPSYIQQSKAYNASSSTETAIVKDSNEVIVSLSTRYDAEMVRDSVFEALDQYGCVTVADVYDLAGVTNTEFSDNKWGWTKVNLSPSDIKIRPNRGQYLLYLPSPDEIRR